MFWSEPDPYFTSSRFGVRETERQRDRETEEERDKRKRDRERTKTFTRHLFNVWNPINDFYVFKLSSRSWSLY